MDWFFGEKEPEFNIPTHKETSSIMSGDGVPHYYTLLDYEFIKNKYTASESVIVGIIDNGVGNHIDLEGDVRFRADETHEEGYGSDHGTHVAGIMSGDKFGLLKNCRIRSYKGMRSSGSGASSAVANLILQANKDGVRILNLSLGSRSPSSKVRAAAEIFLRDKKNFMFVATGNDGGETNYPAKWAADFDNMIAVGSGDIVAENTVVFSEFSSNGVVTVIAQGEYVKSTVVSIKDSYRAFSGTSMACPSPAIICAVQCSLVDHFNCYDWHKVMSKSTIDMNIIGADNFTGWGFMIPREVLAYTEDMQNGVISRGTKKDVLNYIIKKEEKVKLTFWQRFFKMLERWAAA